MHVMMCALEGEQFEGEGEAEEPVPEIFEQQDFVPEGKSCPWSLFVLFTFNYCYNRMHC